MSCDEVRSVFGFHTQGYYNIYMVNHGAIMLTPSAQVAECQDHVVDSKPFLHRVL